MLKLKRGMWLKRTDDIGPPINYWNRPYYKVRKVYPCKTLFDAVMYTYDGKFIGRDSPVMGGPKKFEPALDISYFSEVPAPDWAPNV